MQRIFQAIACVHNYPLVKSALAREKSQTRRFRATLREKREIANKEGKEREREMYAWYHTSCTAINLVNEANRGNVPHAYSSACAGIF